MSRLGSPATSPTPTGMSSNSIAVMRLTEERKQWRKDHPFVSNALSTNIIGILCETNCQRR